jgi:hypothetical protein
MLCTTTPATTVRRTRVETMPTAPTRRAKSWSKDPASMQMTQLAKAFAVFTSSVPELKVDVVGCVAEDDDFVHPVAGFHVRLNGGGETGVSLYVSSRYAELVQWRPGVGALRERFEVSLDDPGYGWGESTFPTAEELAHDLVAYMQFTLDALRKN